MTKHREFPELRWLIDLHKMKLMCVRVYPEGFFCKEISKPLSHKISQAIANIKPLLAEQVIDDEQLNMFYEEQIAAEKQARIRGNPIKNRHERKKHHDSRSTTTTTTTRHHDSKN